MALWLLGAGVAASAAGSDVPGVVPVDPASRRVGEGAPLGYGDAAVLGLVEGLTEFLPVSSTGHLILAGHFLDLDRLTPALDASNTTLWLEPPSGPEAGDGRVFTVKDAVDAYVVVIQLGAILAVAVIYWNRIISILAGLAGRDPAGLRLLRNLLVAFFPAAVVGLAVHRYVEQIFSIPVVVAALVTGAVLMLIVSRWQHRKADVEGARLPDPAPSDLTVRQSLVIGVLQCVALWPGMSRSMMTLVGGYLVGLRPARSAEFTFLLGLVTLGAASFYQGLQSGPLMVKALGAAPLLVGGLVAAVSAALAVRWMVGYLNRHGLAVFAWYRLALAAAVLVWLS